MRRIVFSSLVLMPLALSAAIPTTVKSFNWSMPATTVDGSTVYVAGAVGNPPTLPVGAIVISGTRIYCGGALVVDVPAPATATPFPANMSSYAGDGSFTSCQAAVYDQSGAEGLRSQSVSVANIAGKFFPGSTLAAPGSFSLSLQ